MKLLAIGDPHFQVGNIKNVELFIDRAVNIVKEHRPEIIVILGDLLHEHERLHVTPLNKAYEFVDKMRKLAKTYVIVGNHDMVNHAQFLTANHWMNGLKEWENVTVVDTAIRVGNFALCPYVPPGRFQEALDTIGEWRDVHAIFCHQEFAGCKMGAIVSVEGDKWGNDCPHIISGHIHDRQQPQPNIYYTGSSMQHAFGESGKKSVALLEFDSDGSFSTQEIMLKLPKKKIVYMDVAELDDYVPVESVDEVKLTITGSHDEFKALKKTEKYKTLIESGVKVVFKSEKIRNSDSDEKKSEESSNFGDVLLELVQKEKDSLLTQTYELIVNNKNLSEDDVFFL